MVLKKLLLSLRNENGNHPLTVYKNAFSEGHNQDYNREFPDQDPKNQLYCNRGAECFKKDRTEAYVLK